MRARVPAGSAAVLLNPVHKHSDLVLPIDAIEDRLFAQIDGARTIDEIERSCAEKNVADRALPFYEADGLRQNLGRYAGEFDAMLAGGQVERPNMLDERQVRVVDRELETLVGSLLRLPPRSTSAPARIQT